MTPDQIIKEIHELNPEMKKQDLSQNDVGYLIRILEKEKFHKNSQDHAKARFQKGRNDDSSDLTSNNSILLEMCKNLTFWFDYWQDLKENSEKMSSSEESPPLLVKIITEEAFESVKEYIEQLKEHQNSDFKRILDCE